MTIPSTRICTNSERGMLGVAVDPAFAANNYIYLFYTFRRPDSVCVNRVSRFTLPAGNVIDAASELVLVDNMPSPAGNHNAGDVHFGRDGYLYISIGDGGCDYAGGGCAGSNDAARDQHVLTGKILRVTSTGGIPPSNPFQGAGTARCNVTGSTTAGNRCQETFAWGLRNPFRIAFDPNTFGTARFFINDVGQGAREEINLGQAGADYGWNCLEGTIANPQGSCSPTPMGMVDPIFEYSHTTGCRSITGGAFIPNNLWPGATYNAGYLYSDFICGKIFLLSPVPGGGYTPSEFATGLGGGSAVHMTFGPFGTGQALYYTTYANGGQVRRISYQEPTEPLDFYTVAPCRVVDTRNPPGPLGGPALTGNVSRVFDVRNACGIPATVDAIAVNVTLTSPTLPGFLRIYPWVASAPTSSILNFSAGQTRSNNAILRLTDGRFTAAAAMQGTNGTAHLIVDVVGYFE